MMAERKREVTMDRRCIEGRQFIIDSMKSHKSKKEGFILINPPEFLIAHNKMLFYKRHLIAEIIDVNGTEYLMSLARWSGLTATMSFTAETTMVRIFSFLALCADGCFPAETQFQYTPLIFDNFIITYAIPEQHRFLKMAYKLHNSRTVSQTIVAKSCHKKNLLRSVRDAKRHSIDSGMGKLSTPIYTDRFTHTLPNHLIEKNWKQMERIFDVCS